MYKYINPNNKHLNEIKECGSELLFEIIEMLPEEMKKYLQLISEGIQTKNYEYISRGVHSVKRSVSYFIDSGNPIFEFCNDFENKSRLKMEEQRNKSTTVESIDFAHDLEELKEIARIFIIEIKQFEEEYKNGKYS